MIKRICDLLVVHSIFFIFDDIGMRGDYMKKVAYKKYQKNIFDERFTLESSGPFAFQEYHFRGPPSNLYTLSLYIPPSLLTPSLFLSLISFAVKLFRPSFRNFFKQCKYQKQSKIVTLLQLVVSPLIHFSIICCILVIIK